MNVRLQIYETLEISHGNEKLKRVHDYKWSANNQTIKSKKPKDGKTRKVYSIINL